MCEICDMAIGIVKLQSMRRPDSDWHAIGTPSDIVLVGYENEKTEVIRLTWAEVKLALASVDA